MRIGLGDGRFIEVAPRFIPARSGAPLLRLKARRTFPPGHPSTVLALELLAAAMVERRCQRVLDVGCGCGILALTAARLGAGLAVGLDLDGAAPRCSRDNAVANGLAAKTCWLHGPLTAVRGSFDAVLANLPRPVLEALWNELLEHTAAAGRLIVAGFQDFDRRALEDLIRRHRLRVERRLSRVQAIGEPLPGIGGGWEALCLVRSD